VTRLPPPVPMLWSTMLWSDLCSQTRPRACEQVSDGAGAVLLMTRREAHRRQLPVLGVFRSFSAVGVDPAIMGVGPSVCPVATTCTRLALLSKDY